MATRIPPETKKLRILIVDDHPIVCRGLRQLISDEPDMEVCGEAEDVPKALHQVDASSPDVAILDLTLKQGHGLELIEEIKARKDHVKIIVSSMHDESLFAERALRAGARGYVNKHESPEAIIDAIRCVWRGDIYLSSRMTSRLLKLLAGDQPLAKSPIEGLTNRELQILELIGQGRATKQIAAQLNLSNKTVETHREKIKRKLNLSTASELARHATQWVLENG